MYKYLVVDKHGRQGYVEANTSYEAQFKGARMMGAKKQYEISVYVVEDDKGSAVVHNPSSL